MIRKVQSLKIVIPQMNKFNHIVLRLKKLRYLETVGFCPFLVQMLITQL